ncbi:PstS family phosphate ABC transporter substrate-binding protein [Flavobacterium caseinilyticum]|uniref:Phosphate ABC transporter substrate-binding protein n=1 Tax=Flavobacterium caseinilyticum TaxID=2541732 RepID=A0A4R5AVV6_9FLAO|nr:substrate-binding domain-containing protein [Flavobacterium caseinilyticum]TDD76250.1 phosphate ABC transporter substrate-binding protein [Flavobacterium caseinilyticum]
MKITSKLPALLLLISVLLVFSCNEKKDDKEEETILKGAISIYVDETLKPIIDDQVAVFESKYDAKITLISKSESETINSLFNAKGGVAILSRNLTEEELNVFKQRKITPKITPFATDAIAFVSNKRNNDTLVALKDVVDFMQGKDVPSIKGLVFDNLNSSTLRYLNDLAGITAVRNKGIFSFKTNEEVIKHVSQNDGLIGVVGVNWLSQASPDMQKYVKDLNVLHVKGLTGDSYYLPSQNDIAEKKYPLARDLYIVNCQGFSGLGMGFASFVAGDIGQRIILKSGLLPIRIPGRKFIITGIKNNEK